MALREEENEALKKKLQSSLRGKFNHAFNIKTIKKGRGEILLEHRPVTDFQLKNYGPCPNCSRNSRRNVSANMTSRKV